MSGNDLKAAMIQMNIAWEDAAANRSRAEELIGNLGERVDLVLLPEMFTTGFSMDPERLAEDMSGETIAWMRRTASERGAVVAGSLIICENNNYFNRFAALTPGGEIFTYDKGHLFPLAQEDRVFTQGRERLIFAIGTWKIAPFICYDLRFPLWTRNHKNAFDCMLFTANWPATRASHWETLLRARAIENQAFCIGVNRTGTDGNGTGYSGGSMAFDCRGELLADCSDAEGCTVVTLSRDMLMTYRKDFPYWRDGDEM